jgi:hypothetical protein
VLTRPTYSSMSLGLVPAGVMRVGLGIRVGMEEHGSNLRDGETSAASSYGRTILGVSSSLFVC